MMRHTKPGEFSTFGRMFLCAATTVIFLWSAGCGDVAHQSGGDEESALHCSSADECPVGFACNLFLLVCEPIVEPADGDDETKVETEADVVEEAAEAEPEVVELVDGLLDTDGRRIFVSPVELDFGYVVFGQTVTKTVIVSNDLSASAILNVTRISFKNNSKEIDFTFVPKVGGQVITLPYQLAPGEAFNVLVTYAPDDVIADEGEQLLIISDDQDDPEVRVDLVPQYKGEAHLQVTCDDPRFADDPAAVTFGETPIGSASAVVTLTLTNNCEADGNQVLRISSISLQSSGALAGNGYVLTPSAVITPETSIYLNPQESVTLKVAFNPTTVGRRDDTIYIETNDGDYPGSGFPVELSAIAVANDILILPNPISFGTVKVGQFLRQAVQITNTGNKTLNIQSINVQGTSASLFTLDFLAPGPWTLQKLEAVEFGVIFTPVAGGNCFASLVIVSDGYNPSTLVAMDASGGVANISATPAEVNFGNVQPGLPGRVPVRIQNSGSWTLQVSRIEVEPVGGRFAFEDAADLYTPINPTFNRTLYVTFDPDVIKPSWQGAVRIFSDAVNTDADGSITIPLTAASSNPEFSIMPLAVEFTPVEINSTDIQAVTITNVGSDGLIIHDLALATGSSSSLFLTNVPALPVELSRNESLQFKAEFTPRAAGEANGTVIITHNDIDLFQEGDKDRTDFLLPLHASGTVNHKPVAVLTVNNKTVAPINVKYNGLIELSAAASTDPDASQGDYIADWDFTIEAAPTGYLALRGSNATRSTNGNVPGEWLFGLRVQDSHGLWSDLTTFKVNVLAQNTIPVAVIRANGSVNDTKAYITDQVVFDAVPSFDADPGDLIVDWQFAIESAPVGYNGLSGMGASRSVDVNVLGDWRVALRVKDSQGDWSDWDAITVTVEARPNQNIQIVYDGMNWGQCYDLEVIPPAAMVANQEPCNSDHFPVCAWGPTHSGLPEVNMFGNCQNQCFISFFWQTGNQDGVYEVWAKRFLSTKPACYLMSNEKTDVTFIRAGGAYWRCSINWGWFGAADVKFSLIRERGVWTVPTTVSSNVTCVAE